MSCLSPQLNSLAMEQSLCRACEIKDVTIKEMIALIDTLEARSSTVLLTCTLSFELVITYL